MGGKTMHIDPAEDRVKLGGVPTETLGKAVPRALMQADCIIGHPCPDPGGEDQDWLYLGDLPIVEEFNPAKLIGQDSPVPPPIVRA